MEVYARLSKTSDIQAYKPIDKLEEYSILVAYLDVDGKPVTDKKYAGLILKCRTLRELRDKMWELRTLGYMVKEEDLDAVTSYI